MKLKSFCSYLNSTNKILDANKTLQSIDSDSKWRLKRDNILWNCGFFLFIKFDFDVSVNDSIFSVFFFVHIRTNS